MNPHRAIARRRRVLLPCLLAVLSTGAGLAGAQGCNALWGLDDLQFGSASSTGGSTSTSTSTAAGTGGTRLVDAGQDADAAGTGGTSPVDAGQDADAGREAGGCTRDLDCAGSPNGGVCDPATSTCVECLVPSHPCPAGQFCDTSNACQAGCTTNADCAPLADGGTGADGGGTDGSAGTGGAGTGGAGTGDAGTGGGGPAPADAGAVTCDVPTHTCVGCVADAACPLGTVCTGGKCLAGCNAAHGCQAGQSCCGGACRVTNTTDSVATCGACAIACTALHGTPSCIGGTCEIACNAGYGDCDGDPANGCETSVEGDVANCGACGAVCGTANTAAVACVAGACQLVCAKGWGSCDGDPSNGCETDMQSSTVSCGACGAACTNAHGGTSCAGARCIPTCASGFGDCDGNPNNGCEANLATDPIHCGSCTTACGSNNAAGACNGGTCTEVCTAGYENCDGLPGNGCECAGTACCGAGCQTKHNNGLGGAYHDCLALGPPYTQQMALDACAAVTGSVAACAPLSCSGNNQAICTNVPGQTTCQCWDYAGTHAGYAGMGPSCLCPGGNGQYPWN